VLLEDLYYTTTVGVILRLPSLPPSCQSLVGLIVTATLGGSYLSFADCTGEHEELKEWLHSTSSRLQMHMSILPVCAEW
jgi:hypothetical protein